MRVLALSSQPRRPQLSVFCLLVSLISFLRQDCRRYCLIYIWSDCFLEVCHPAIADFSCMVVPRPAVTTLSSPSFPRGRRSTATTKSPTTPSGCTPRAGRGRQTPITSYEACRRKKHLQAQLTVTGPARGKVSALRWRLYFYQDIKWVSFFGSVRRRRHALDSTAVFEQHVRACGRW